MRRETRTVPFAQEVPVEAHLPERGGEGACLVALHGMGMSPAACAHDALPLLPDGAAAVIPQAPLPFGMRGAGGPRQGNAGCVCTARLRTRLGTLPEAEMAAVEEALRIALGV